MCLGGARGLTPHNCRSLRCHSNSKTNWMEQGVFLTYFQTGVLLLKLFDAGSGAVVLQA